MYKNSFLRPILLVGMITVLFASCDKDYDEMGTNIVGDDHFGFDRYIDATVKAYNQPLGTIASNNLTVNPLGFYDNPVFGETQANFVTQVEMATTNPTFNNTDPTLYEKLPKVDSVVLEIPYFVKFKEKVSGKSTFMLDSIYPAYKVEDDVEATMPKFKLSVYQSNYYLRDLDPSEELGEQQVFYTDKDAEIDGMKNNTLLNDTIKSSENTEFYFDKREHRTTKLDDDGDEIPTRSAPSMRLHLNRAFFKSLILDAPSGKLADNTIFKDYFRGLYFKTEKISGNPGKMAMLNFKGGKITIYYREDKKTVKTVAGVITTTYPRVFKTFVLNLTGNTVSLQNNLTTNPVYSAVLNNPNYATQEASKLYLKGGSGSMAVIDLFSSVDAYHYEIYRDGAGNPIDETGQLIKVDSNDKPLVANEYLLYLKKPGSNDISDELDDLRYPHAFPDDPTSPLYVYYSKKNRWMVNEANLTFTIDQATMTGTQTFEPNRIYLYDLTNKKALADYSYDFTSSSLFPKYNKYIFGGILLDKDEKVVKQKDPKQDNIYVKKGVMYKLRITNHLRNLIKNDSTNVRLGLVVNENINNISFSKLKNPVNPAVKTAPTLSAMSPLGTVLFGTGMPSDDADYAKRLKLEIYYTKPD